MRARTEILRIRTAMPAAGPVTHKRLPDAGPGEDRHKHRVETETEVADGKVLAEVFLSLGLVAAFHYEKWRAGVAGWRGPLRSRRNTHRRLCRARRGLPNGLTALPARLGVRPADYITLSYGRLFDQWRQQHGSSATDLTFQAISASSSRQ